MPFKFQRLSIPDVILIEPARFDDSRGFFMETYKKSEFEKNGITGQFIQDNLSHSKRDTLRGLHYQNHPRAQAKLVSVCRGKVFDVAVDIRRGSPTFGKWVSIILSEDKFQMLYIPEGFAHGFCVLSGVADFVYKVTDEWSREYEAGILWNDAEIGIDWPLKKPRLSNKDAQLPRLQSADFNFEYRY